MSQIPYYNAGKNAVYIGGRCIQPGDTREVDAALIPRQPAPVAVTEPQPTAEAEPAVFDAEAALGGTVNEVKADIAARDDAGMPVITDDQLAAMGAFEADNANRRTLLEAIEAERLARAAAQAEGDAA